MKILFLDQTGQLGGAERSIMSIAKSYRNNCLMGLFESGPFQDLLTQNGIPVQVLASKPIPVRRESSFFQGLVGLGQFIPLLVKVIKLAFEYDVIYANTPKALVVGAMASLLTRRPLVYHLRDILTPEHFSGFNRRLIIFLANSFATQVIAVSQATQQAFIDAGGNSQIIRVIYNGFELKQFQGYQAQRLPMREKLGLTDKFVIGHFSRLAFWKGQHVLIEALSHCSDNVIALLVGDALFGEQEYYQQLHQLVGDLGLETRVHFLGFRSDIPQLMAACDLVTHTSTAPEPASRVLMETMLCGKPLVATQEGGSVEIVNHGKTGWLIPPRDSVALAKAIMECQQQPEQTAQIATQACLDASKRFGIENTRRQIDQLLREISFSSGIEKV